ncbi:MAG: hypothetical protein K1X74_00655 [Pirellulales bacterium]|nr:hypothetical protein [Pirellulales bacterium]
MSTSALVSAGAAVLGVWLAQASAGEQFWPGASEASSVAILAWYAWHNATRVVPRLLREQRVELSEARTQFREELARQRTTFAETLAEERQQHLVELGMWQEQLTACYESWRSLSS